MGYTHDTAMSQYIPPTLVHAVTGAWTWTAGAVTGTIAKRVAATDETTVINIPIIIPSNSIAEKGARLTSIEVDFEILTAACDAVDALVNLVERGLDTAVAVVTAQAFSYDTGHDTAAERYAVEQHRMTLTLTTPIWLTNNQYVLVEITANKAATTTIQVLSAVANYTLRL